ncbi:MAG: hypothetical protein AAGC53_03645 [Actinomycetota bacterium]
MAKRKARPAGLSDVELIRRIEYSATQAMFNRYGAEFAREQAKTLDDGDPGIEYLDQRSVAGDNEAAYLEAQLPRLMDEAAARRIECSKEPSCTCARCGEDGPHTVYLGDGMNVGLVGRRTRAELYVARTERPRRTPFVLRWDRDGRLVTADRGKSREQAMEILRGFVAGVGEQSRAGRDPGHGMDIEAIVKHVDGLRDLGATVQDACEATGGLYGFAPASVHRAYYDHDRRRRDAPGAGEEASDDLLG